MANYPQNEDSSKAFMDALTATDERHRRAMRGATPELVTTKLKAYYNLTDTQAARAYQLRDVEGVSEDEAIKVVRNAVE